MSIYLIRLLYKTSAFEEEDKTQTGNSYDCWSGIPLPRSENFKVEVRVHPKGFTLKGTLDQYSGGEIFSMIHSGRNFEVQFIIQKGGSAPVPVELTLIPPKAGSSPFLLSNPTDPLDMIIH